jgi:hypothetical protein
VEWNIFEFTESVTENIMIYQIACSNVSELIFDKFELFNWTVENFSNSLL